jgi:type I restriction enzyme S subunit
MSRTNWATVRLAEVADVRLGRQRSPKRSVGPNMRPYMRAANVTWAGISLHDVKEMDFSPHEFETYALRRGDILLAEASGSASEVGKPAVWNEQVPDCCFQNTLIRVRTTPELVPFLHLHFYKDALTGAFARASRGVGIHHLGAEALVEWELQLPAVAEQRRIVSALESYFTRLNDAVATLERVQRNLKRYRASVLKAAVEGRLVPTEAELARAEGRSYEAASTLLTRILAERRRRWEEAELAKIKAKGRVPKDDKWKAKYVEPIAPDTSELPLLPEGWCWASAEALSDETRSITYGVVKLGPVTSGGIPTLRSSNVRHLRLDLDYVKPISRRVSDGYRRTVLQGDEVLVTVRGTLGGVAATPATCVGFNISREVAMIALIEPRLTSLVAIFIASDALQNWIMRRTRGIAYTGINIGTLKELPIPLPPLAEQSRIVESVDRQLSVGDATEASAVANVLRCRGLRQSILTWAFEGRLVDQDPTDEPASVLLERIRAERASATDTPPRRARRANGRAPRS